MLVQMPILGRDDSRHPPMRKVCSPWWVIVFTCLALSGVADAQTLSSTARCSEPSSGETEADLDRLFALHDYVFAARVDRVVRRGVLADEEVPEDAELFVYQPALRGSVPDQLRFDRNQPCAPRFTEGAVYLLFLNDLETTPFRSEARLMLATEQGPAVPWLFDWLQTRSESPPAATAGRPALNGTDDLQDDYRVLLLGAGLNDEERDSLFALRRELRERDVLWFVLDGAEPQSNYTGPVSGDLIAELAARLAGSSARVALIGKDGGLKLRDQRLDLEEVLARIDSMPMRQREMRGAVPE